MYTKGKKATKRTSYCNKAQASMPEETIHSTLLCTYTLHWLMVSCKQYRVHILS